MNDTSHGFIDLGVNTEVHVTLTFGVCISIPNFVSLSIDALFDRTANVESNVGGTIFGENSAQLVAQVF